MAEGSDADVIIFDPAVRHTISAKAHHSAMDTNIYEGYEVTGKVSAFVRLQGKVPWKSICKNGTRRELGGGTLDSALDARPSAQARTSSSGQRLPVQSSVG